MHKGKNMQVSKDVAQKFIVLEDKLKEMRKHEVFSSLQKIADLQQFMQWHVFAVWDFMSLAKRLQQEFTCVTVPWMPPKQPQAARLINEIILGEETDKLADGKTLSHFEMYLLAMKEVGACTIQIETFLECLEAGSTIDKAFLVAKVDPAIQKFVKNTLDTVLNGNIAQILGSFFYGREDSIPEMFAHLLKKWSIDPNQAEIFVYYLNRHIELDSDEHGPAVKKIMQEILTTNLQWHDLIETAIEAVQQRIELWDALYSNIKMAV